MLGGMDGGRLLHANITAKESVRRKQLLTVKDSGSLSWRVCLADEDMTYWRRVITYSQILQTKYRHFIHSISLPSLSNASHTQLSRQCTPCKTADSSTLLEHKRL